MKPFIPANEQIEATRPDRSNWVSANAGSGKTHVLTQRVARLLLAGAAPQKILCLTYTKAAAAEMQTRLFQTLGQWAMEPEAALAARLGDLAGESPNRDPAQLAEARRLFARALETPGGLKIQTIHAFCDTLLRRFPLEAGISPRFEVADDRTSDQIRGRLRTTMAEAAEAGTDDAFARAAARLNEGGIDDLAAGVLARRMPFRDPDPEPALAAHFGAEAQMTEQDVCREALTQLDWPTYAALAEVLRAHGGKADSPIGEALPLEAQTRDANPQTAVQRLMLKVLTQKMEARSTRGFPVSAVKKVRPSAEDELRKLTDWALATRDRQMAVRNAARARDLHKFAHSLLGRLDLSKAARGLVDFDDLIESAAALLTQSDMRAWVLYKLDAGIDHILVDEAQDTSPRQWDVIAAIAEEFLAGEGARPEGRSLFVVGDEKQSIYSFQGAEPQAFGHMRDTFAEKLEALGTPLGQPRLETSYRSAPAILDFVDAVFAGNAAEGLTMRADPVRHRAHRQGDGARVDLWPAIERAEAPEAPPWYEPVDAPTPDDPKTVLAAEVAQHIAELVTTGTLPPRSDGSTRKVRAGDILVLVTKRDRLARGIIRELKTRDVPVAGADRLSLTAELAVQDLLALIRVVLMPSDDLSLAALLRSPICGITEDELFDLAHGREGTLLQAVQNAPRHSNIADFLRDMAGNADYLRPYEFLEHALIHHGARAALLARLGEEVEDPIDELLSQALAYELREPPSLTGFLAWIEAGEIAVKREMERGLDAVRVMTVHGAKGLEAPVVILPDTFSTRRGGGKPILLPAEAKGNAPALVLWAADRKQDDQVTRRAREAAEARETAERDRLLYVALTRAEDWLILCGARPSKDPKGSWYAMLEAAFERLPAGNVTGVPAAVGQMRRFQSGRADGVAMPEDASPELTNPENPTVLGSTPYEPRRERGSPSGLVAKTAKGGTGLGRALAMRRGTAVHAVLERIADIPIEDQSLLAKRLLQGQFADLSPEIQAEVYSEARAVLDMPDAKWLFGSESLAEVSLGIDPPENGARMIGRVDRLVVLPDACWVVDIKTDAAPPQDVNGVAKAYLAQLGAYASAANEIWSGKPVRTAILWTAGPSLMEIPTELCDAAFHSTSFARTGRA
ncbi:MAG: double-strand break repair helicase AddA [Paracoccaceae bacterium]